MDPLNKRLAEIRDQQGRDPMPDPTRIEGFGPGHPPTPSTPDVQTSWPEDWDGEGEPPDDPPSPMIPATDYVVRKIPLAPNTFLPVNDKTEKLLPKPDLLIVGEGAYFRGFDVVLNQAEQDEVAGVVVRAVRRKLDELDGDRVRGLLGAVVDRASEIVPKKRGRPKKVKA